MSDSQFQNNSGSVWNRWEPHVHAPGTVLNDQYSGQDPWSSFLTNLEQAHPVIKSIGITDYYITDSYERILAEKDAGRLSDCDLIFPNIEMRCNIGTVKGRWINVHLLVSPEKDGHLEELKRFMSRLTFDAYNDSFACIPEDLRRLGKECDPNITKDHKALMKGVEQFKVSFGALKYEYQKSEWAKKNILIAVSGNGTDGTSGLKDAADATLRKEIERFAHIIFSSNSKDRDFWLGKGVADLEQIEQEYDGPKPCLHGCDAHEHAKVGVPDHQRYSWIKGKCAFDTLRQVCIGPERACVSENPPMKALPSQVINRVEVSNAGWLDTKSLDINSGLVAIIGARGSGKTALADIIAAGCYAAHENHSDTSFLRRAKELLNDEVVSINWGEGKPEKVDLNRFEEVEYYQHPKVRYLSQQFVEDLCKADTMTDALVEEIERVIFEAHPLSERDGCNSFCELRDLKATRFRETRRRNEEELQSISDQVAIELDKRNSVNTIEKKIQGKKEIIDGYQKDSEKLVSEESDAHVKYLEVLMTAAETVRGYLSAYNIQHQDLLTLFDEVTHDRSHTAPEMLRNLQNKHQKSGLNDDDWQKFLMDYKGNVDEALSRSIKFTTEQAFLWKGETPDKSTKPDESILPKDTEYSQVPLSLLEAEISRVQSLVNVDRQIAEKFTTISKKITEENATLQKLNIKLEDCKGASARLDQLISQREASYKEAFTAITNEQNLLNELYKPLMDRTSGSLNSLGKISFSVERVADVAKWAYEGEQLLDLRKAGHFKGQGALLQASTKILLSAWETGAAEQVSIAMKEFLEKKQKDLLSHARVSKDEPNYREWANRFAKWLYSTDHISLHYSLNYDKTDIRKLSPGTRGIVLLLLYLALDDNDDRPLIIDQPEENLDPKSIFDELVDLFTETKSNRQIIMVTHNANLVVNTDADQIIIAESEYRESGHLPHIRYISGGLEEAHIREAVCGILEGGDRAFQKRAKRLRIKLQR